MNTNYIREQLKQKVLKITSQCVTNVDAVVKLNTYSKTKKTIDFIKVNHSNIFVETIYKIIESFLVTQLLKKVKTEKEDMCYNSIMLQYQHIYYTKTNRIKNIFKVENYTR